MDDEKLISGYCRQLDGSRTVTAELKNGIMEYVDCSYETCVYRSSCTIAKELDKLK